MATAKKAAKTTGSSQPSPKAAKVRNWTWFTPRQQERFLQLQEKKGLDGSALLSLAFSEYADRQERES